MYFTKKNSNLASCITCGQKITTVKGSTSGCRYHLRYKHPHLFKELLGKARERRDSLKEVEEAMAATAASSFSDSEEEDPALARTKKTKLPEGHDDCDNQPEETEDHYYKTPRDQLAFDMWVTEYLVESDLPVSHLAKDGFRKFCSRVHPGGVVKPVEIFAREKLPRMAEAIRKDLVLRWTEEMKAVKEVAFTCHIEPYTSGVHVYLWFHYINSDWEYQRFLADCLAVKEEDNFAAIMKIMETCFGKIPGVIVPSVVVTPWFTSLKESVLALGSRASRCITTSFDNMLRSALSGSPQLERILAEALMLFSRFPSVVPHDPARMSSVGPTIESLKRTELPELLDCEFEALQSMGHIFSRFEVYCRLLSVDQDCTTTLVLSTLVNMQGWLQTYSASLPGKAYRLQLEGLVKDLMDDLEKQYPNAGTGERRIRYGHFFHPHFRGILLRKYNKYDDTIHQLVERHPTTQTFRDDLDPTDDNEEDLEPAEKLALELGGSDIAIQGEREAPLRKEIRVYLALPKPIERAKVNVLEWWKQHSNTIPLLSQMAKDILCVPASALAVGPTAKPRRIEDDLDAQTFSTLTYCRANWKKVSVHDWCLEEETPSLQVDADNLPSTSSGRR